MNYNIGNGANASILSIILGKSASPNMGDNDMRHNLNVKARDDFNIVCKIVMCYNEAVKFDKVKSKILPGKWLVTGHEEWFFVVQNDSNILKLSRYMLKVICPF